MAGSKDREPNLAKKLPNLYAEKQLQEKYLNQYVSYNRNNYKFDYNFEKPYEKKNYVEDYQHFK